MDSSSELEQLLSELSEALEKDSAATKQTSEGFNIFSVLGLETKEVIICRFLGELLNPNGSHGMGVTPLKKFVRNVLHEKVSDEDAQQAYIELEERITGNRRVDIVIHASKRVFPIEVKVWAGDQDAQLTDYFNYYKDHYGNDKIYYLTPTGWKPSKKSKGNLTVDKQIALLSFHEDIRKWCEELCENECSPVVQCVKQFVEVIEKMCAKNNDLENIKNVLGLNENDQFDASNQLMLTAIKLLSNKDEIEKTIMRKYLYTHLKYDESQYSCGESLSEEEDKIDSHALLKIVSKSKKTVAWICVATNLYLVAQKVKEKEATRFNGTPLWIDDSSEGRGYFWQYIMPKGYTQKKFPLKELTKLPGFPD